MIRKFYGTWLLVLAGLVGANGQTITPVKTTWKERYDNPVVRTNPIKEVRDGNMVQKEADKIKNMSLPIPTGATVNKFKNTEADGLQTLSGDSPEPTIQFDGLSDGQLRGIGTIPPDTYGSVGYNEVVTVTNSEIVIRNKVNGQVVPGSQQGIDNFFGALNFGGSAPDVFDPRVIFDPYSNRYVVVVCVNGGNLANSGFAIAVSQTSNPAGAWSFYAIDTDGSNTTWFDFPYVAFNRNWIYISGSMFNGSDAYTRSKIYVFDKNNLYGGGNIAFNSNAREIALEGLGTNFCAANDYDQTSDSMYVVQTWNGNFEGSSILKMGAITGTLPNVSFSTVGFIVNEGVTYATSSGSTDFAEQTGGNVKINTGDSRMGNAMRINNDLWCAHTIFQPATTPTRCSPEWFQLGLNATVKQTQIIGTTAAQYRYYPSIVANKLGDVLVGYSVSNKDIWVGSAYRTRQAADALNTTRTEYIYQEGRAYYNKTFGGSRNRWGDYSNSVIDPSNQSLWTIQEFSSSPALGNNNQLISMWGTWWANIQASGNAAALPVKLTAFEAQLSEGTKTVLVNWSVTGESGIRQYCVERSKDGVVFERIGCVDANNANGSATYRFTDRDPLFGASFYRLRTVEKDGGTSSSQIRRIDRSQLRPVMVSVYPNPIADALSVRWYSPSADVYTVTLSNQMGQVIHSRQASVTEGYYIETVNTSALPAGTYNYVLRNANGWQQAGRVVKQ